VVTSFLCVNFGFVGESEESAKGAFWKPLRSAQGKFAYGKYCEAPLDSPKTFNRKSLFINTFLKFWEIQEPSQTSP
jgi:hypothetical protein